TNHSAAKAGVVGFTRALAHEMGPLGLRVNCVSPGVIDTGLIRQIPPKKLERLTARTPLRRLGRPEEIASVVAFLAGEDASFITGQVIPVNGGLPSPV